MINLLAAEGGYQAFHLSGADKTWLYICLVAGIVGIAAGLLLARNVLSFDQGTVKMNEIAKAVQEGAQAYLRRQFRAIAMHHHSAGDPDLLHRHQVVTTRRRVSATFQQDGLVRDVCFLPRGGLLRPDRLHRHEHRGAGQRPDRRGGASRFLTAALKIAFRTGAITGLFVVGLGLLGATLIVTGLPEHRDRCAHRLRLRRVAHRPVHASRRGHLHQGGRRGG